jgi:hypothetical protein
MTLQLQDRHIDDTQAAANNKHAIVPVIQHKSVLKTRPPINESPRIAAFRVKQ